MRQMIKGLVAACAALGALTVPAMACGSYGCSPCGVTALLSPCGYAPGYYGYGYSYDAYGYNGYGYLDYERLPRIAVPRWQAIPQYYHVDQGPAYGGPGNFAPYPAYREHAVGTAHVYGPGYAYNGGPYANAMHHHYVGGPVWHGPAIYRYRAGRLVHGPHAHRHRHHHHRAAAHRAGARSAYRGPRVIQAQQPVR
jgi:hypothetical protein